MSQANSKSFLVSGKRVDRNLEKYPIPSTPELIGKAVAGLISSGGVQHLTISQQDGFIRVIRAVPKGKGNSDGFFVYQDLSDAQIEELEPPEAPPLVVFTRMFNNIESMGYRVVVLVVGSLKHILTFAEVTNNPILFGAQILVDDTIDPDSILFCGASFSETDGDRIRMVYKVTFPIKETGHEGTPE